MRENGTSGGRLWSGQMMFDGAVAIAATVLSLSILVPLTERASGDDAGRATAVAAVLVSVHGLALAGRRGRPVVSWALVMCSGLAVVALDWPTVVLGVSLVISAYSVGAELRTRTSLIALGATLVATVLAQSLAADDSDLSTRLGNLVVLSVAWFLGSTIRARREYARDLEQRNRELEAARDELAEKAVADERLRIARELHDVIAHSMSLIAVQSGAGRAVIESDPVEAKRSLEAIEAASRSALVEVRRVLGVLRHEDEESPLGPAPSLEGLDDLVARTSLSGVRFELHRRGDVSGLPSGIQLTIYRLVQEALTNVIKHARATTGRVLVSREDRLVRVEVVDDGVAASAGVAEGTGLRGMRERVGAYGGTLDAGALPEGGFRIAASIPLGTAP